MLETQNLLPTEPRGRLAARLCSMFILLFVLAFSVILGETYALEPENVNIDRHGLDIVENDVLTVYIKPVAEQVSVDCEPLDRGKPFDLQISTNYTDTLFGRITAVWMRPESRGKYNLTIAFQSGKVWDYMIGVYTRNVDFYLDFYGKNVKFSGNFGQFFTFTRQSGDWTINIILESHGQQSSSIFNVELPTPMNAVLFLTAAGLVAYFNLFLVVDTYFKNKKETVSTKERILIAIVVIISAFAVYYLYNWTTFKSLWGV